MGGARIVTAVTANPDHQIASPGFSGNISPSATVTWGAASSPDRGRSLATGPPRVAPPALLPAHLLTTVMAAQTLICFVSPTTTSTACCVATIAIDADQKSIRRLPP